MTSIQFYFFNLFLFSEFILTVRLFLKVAFVNLQGKDFSDIS